MPEQDEDTTAGRGRKGRTVLGQPSCRSSLPTRVASKELSDTALPGPGAFMGPVRRVPINGMEIGYRQFGSGPDLLVITGDTGTMSLWGTEFPGMLSAHFRVTLFDNRGVGYSTDDVSVPMTIQLLADDTAQLIRALHLRRPDVLGWSMGGEIGLTLSVRHPGILRRLVTTGADTGGRRAVPASNEVQDLFNQPNLTFEQLLNVMFPASAVAARRRFIEQYRSIPQESVSVETVRRQGEAEAIFTTSEETWTRLADVKTRMLITNGSSDIVTPPRNADIIVERVGSERAEKVIFSGAGHGMWFQEINRFVGLVVEFLRPSHR